MAFLVHPISDQVPFQEEIGHKNASAHSTRKRLRISQESIVPTHHNYFVSWGKTPSLWMNGGSGNRSFRGLPLLKTRGAEFELVTCSTPIKSIQREHTILWKDAVHFLLGLDRGIVAREGAVAIASASPQSLFIQWVEEGSIVACHVSGCSVRTGFCLLAHV